MKITKNRVIETMFFLLLVAFLCWALPALIRADDRHAKKIMAEDALNEKQERQNYIDRGMSRLAQVKEAVSSKLAVCNQLLNKPQNQWGYADQKAWDKSIEVLDAEMSWYSSINHEYSLDQPGIDTKDWPIQIRAAIH